MSEKILAIMEAVENPVAKLEGNLLVKVSKEEWGLEIQEYDICLGLDNPSLFISNANGFPLWLYFQFIGRRSSNLRNRYFDIVRSLGLKEMWLMWEDLMDYFEPYDDDIPAILAKMTAKRNPNEFAERTLIEFDLKSLLCQKPYKDDIYPYSMFYHDTFSDLFKKVTEIESEENVVVLGLTEFEEGKIRVLHPDGYVASFAIR